MRRKILTVESEYGRRSREENEKEPLWNLAASPLASRAIASRRPRTRDNIPPATQARSTQALNLAGPVEFNIWVDPNQNLSNSIDSNVESSMRRIE